MSWALHVLSRPSDHGIFLRWAMETRERLGTTFMDALLELPPFAQGWLSAIAPATPSNDAPTTFLHEWESYMSLTNDQLQAGYQRIYERWTTHYDQNMARNSEWEAMAYMTKTAWWSNRSYDLEALRDHAGDLMKKLWEQEFETVWNHIEGDLTRDVESRRSRLGAEDMGTWWRDVSPRFLLGKDGQSLQVLVPWRNELTVAPAGRVVLVPSVFCWPHLWVDGRDNEVTVTYQVDSVRRWAAPVPAPDRLAPLLQILSEPTRLLIVRHLFGAMGTTGSVAHALRLSPSTISRHLNLLHSTGLVERITVGHYVLYRTNRDALLSMSEDLMGLQRSPVPDFLGWTRV